MTTRSLSTTSASSPFVTQALLALCGSAFLAVMAQLSLRLPWSPVPISMQPHAVLFLSCLLGHRAAFASVLAYIAEGAMGLPVFAAGGSGLAWLMGPTAGYIWSYLAVAWFIGGAYERTARFSYLRTYALLLAGSAVILASGTVWLSGFLGLQGAVQAGLLPFVAGDLVKCLGVTGALAVSRAIR